jgi:hypothetical protein
MNQCHVIMLNKPQEFRFRKPGLPAVGIGPVTLIMKAIRPSETSVLTRVTWHNILEDGILLSHRRENLKSYIALTSWSL